jgi:hypothetical protein
VSEEPWILRQNARSNLAFMWMVAAAIFDGWAFAAALVVLVAWAGVAILRERS